jgi:hypothetical protein
MNQVTQFETDLIKDMYQLRGRIVSSYSQVEFLLADLSVKLNMKFPYAVKKRLDAARDIADRPEFAPYKGELIAICDDLNQYDEIRHLMAHGYISLTLDTAKNHFFELRMYRREPNGLFNRLEVQTTQVKLASAAEDINQYTQRAVGLFQRIYMELGLQQAGVF